MFDITAEVLRSGRQTIQGAPLKQVILVEDRPTGRWTYSISDGLGQTFATAASWDLPDQAAAGAVARVDKENQTH